MGEYYILDGWLNERTLLLGDGNGRPSTARGGCCFCELFRREIFERRERGLLWLRRLHRSQVGLSHVAPSTRQF